MPDYINPEPPPVDPDEIAQACFDRIRTQFAAYDPRESQLATIVVVALSLRAAELADLIPLIPRAIFRWYGANVVNLPPEDGGPATASVTIFVRDNAGYTIEAGEPISIQDDDGDEHLFELQSDAVIAPGQTSIGNVTLVAQEDGTLNNDITAGTVAFVDALDFVINVTHQGTTANGVDAESDDDYLNRLTRRTSLIPRPVWAQDFADLAMVEFPEIFRMAALDTYAPGLNQIDKIDFTGTVSGGTYTLGVDGPFSGNQVTNAIAWNADAPTTQAAIEALASVEPGDVAVTLGPGPTDMLVEFKGRFANTAITFTITPGGLTGGGTAAIVNQQAATAPNATTVANVSLAGIDSAGNGLSATLKAQVDAFLQANREFGFIVNLLDPSFNLVDATFSFTTFAKFDPTEVKARAEQVVKDYFSPLTFALPPGDARGWLVTTVIRHWEVVTVLNNVEGLDRLVTLTLGINGGAQTAADQTMTGALPMPRPGTVVGTPV